MLNLILFDIYWRKHYLSIRCHEIKSCNVKPESPCLCKLANTCTKTHKVLSGNVGRLPHDLFTGNQIMIYIETFYTHSVY